MLRRHFAQAEITVSQARTLSTLAKRGPQRLTDLALVEQVAQPSMSALIARLEIHGLVERRPDPGEPRTTLISITEEGLELWRSIVALRSKLLAAGLMFLSVSERAALRRRCPLSSTWSKSSREARWRTMSALECLLEVELGNVPDAATTKCRGPQRRLWG